MYFGILPDTSHRALSDAMSAHKLYGKLKEKYGSEKKELFCDIPLQYKAKKERTASKRQKQHLQDLIKYHRINVTVAIDHLSGNEISRMIDKILFAYGRIPEAERRQADIRQEKADGKPKAKRNGKPTAKKAVKRQKKAAEKPAAKNEKRGEEIA